MSKPEKLEITEQVGYLDFDCGSVSELKSILDDYNDDDYLENNDYNNVSFYVFHKRKETDKEYTKRLEKIKQEKEKVKKTREQIIKEAKRLKIKPEELL